MDKRVEKIFRERVYNSEKAKAKYLVEKKLYDIEYIENIDNKFKSLSTGAVISKINEMQYFCERIEDSKFVVVYKVSEGNDNFKQGKKYGVNIPIEINDEDYHNLISSEDSKTNNSISSFLKGFAITYYVFAALVAVIGLSLSIEEESWMFMGVLAVVAMIVFNGLIIHALSYLLTNVVSINRKIK